MMDKEAKLYFALKNQDLSCTEMIVNRAQSEKEESTLMLFHKPSLQDEKVLFSARVMRDAITVCKLEPNKGALHYTLSLILFAL